MPTHTSISRRFAGALGLLVAALAVAAPSVAVGAGTERPTGPIRVATPSPADRVESAVTRRPIRVVGVKGRSFRISWPALRGKGLRYHLYVNRRLVYAGRKTSARVKAPLCGSTRLQVVVTRRSRGVVRRWTSVRVFPCAGVLASDDREAPSRPSGLVVESVTATSATVRWDPATDNVAVVRYQLRRDSVPVATVPATGASATYTFTGLLCGTRPRLSVEAVDAATLASPPAEIMATLALCDPPASVFVSPGGNDGGPCTAPAPCQSLARAYAATKPGEAVEVQAGSYPAQAIPADAGKSGKPRILIRPAAGATPTFKKIDIDATDLEIRGLSLDGGWYIRSSADRVTMRDVITRGQSNIAGAEDVAVIGGEMSDIDSADGLQVKPGTNGRQVRRLLIEGLSVHGITRRQSASHPDCIQVMSGIGVTMRRLRIRDCGTQGVFFKEDVGGQIDGVVVENSVFGNCGSGCYYTLIFDRGVDNALARYNSFSQAPSLGRDVDSTNIRAVGNAGVMTACGSGVEYRHNVWTAVRCSPTDVQSGLTFFDPATLDLRPKSGASVIDLGDPAEAPADDYLGRLRPVGARADAGAYEVG